MKTTPGCLGFLGDYTTQLYWDDNKPSYSLEQELLLSLSCCITQVSGLERLLLQLQVLDLLQALVQLRLQSHRLPQAVCLAPRSAVEAYRFAARPINGTIGPPSSRDSKLQLLDFQSNFVGEVAHPCERVPFPNSADFCTSRSLLPKRFFELEGVDSFKRCGQNLTSIFFKWVETTN